MSAATKSDTKRHESDTDDDGMSAVVNKEYTKQLKGKVVKSIEQSRTGYQNTDVSITFTDGTYASSSRVIEFSSSIGPKNGALEEDENSSGRSLVIGQKVHEVLDVYDPENRGRPTSQIVWILPVKSKPDHERAVFANFVYDHEGNPGSAYMTVDQPRKSASASAAAPVEPEEKAPKRKRKIIVESDSDSDDIPLSKRLNSTHAVNAVVPAPSSTPTAPKPTPVNATSVPVVLPPAAPVKQPVSLTDILKFVKTCSNEDLNQIVHANNARRDSERDEKTRTQMAAIKVGSRVQWLGHAVKGKPGHKYRMTGTVTKLHRTNVDIAADNGGRGWNWPAADCTIIG